MAKQDGSECRKVRRGSTASRRCSCEVCRVLRISEQRLGQLMAQYALALDEPWRFERGFRVDAESAGRAMPMSKQA